MWATIYKYGTSLVLALFAFSASASSEWLKPSHPQTYRVQEGDTLWEIAGHFLKDPWRWPQIWQNSNLENPHLIYPGDTIILEMQDNEPRLSLTRGSNSESVIHKNGQRIVKLSPRIRSLPAERAIPTIPLSEIGPFLTHSKITPVGALRSAPKIAAVDEERILVTAGNRFYVPNLLYPEGEALSIFRPGRILMNPVTNEELGQEAIYLGTAKVEVKAPMSTLILQKSVEEVRAGDYLLPIESERVEPYYLPKLPLGMSHGYILSVLGGVGQIGKNQVIVLSGGLDIAREEGDVLTVLQSNKNLPARVKARENFEKKLHPGDPPEQFEFTPLEVGRVIVFKVFDKTSLALVMDAVRTIHLRDEVRKP